MANKQSLWFLFFLLSSFLIHRIVVADSHFEGFEDLDNNDDEDDLSLLSDLPTRSPPLTLSEPKSTRLSPSSSESPDSDSDSDPVKVSDHPSAESTSDLLKSSPTSIDYWDEDEFEGLPTEQRQQQPPESPEVTENITPTDSRSFSESDSVEPKKVRAPQSFTVEIVCVSFLIIFIINYFTGKRENENIALAWAAKFAAKDSIFEKNFSLLGVGEGDDSPLLLKEGQTVFKFYASGRRCCQKLLATMELKSRHDLISRLYNLVVPCKDEISFEVCMNEDAMDHIVFAVAKKKAAKAMQKEVPDLQRFAGIMSAPSGRKWVADELSVISESKEVTGDLITEAVLDQVFGDKAFEKHGKGFISMHFSDQHPGSHKKMLLFKFALPDANNMGDMTRLVALIPYYIDLIGRYKLSSQARSKTETARLKAAQEAYKEQQNARQEALLRKKAERKKMSDEAEAQLSADAIRKKEAKERARQMKKAMPKMKMTRAH